MTLHPDPAPELGAFDCAPLVEAVERMANALAEDGRHLEAALGAGDEDHAAWCRQQRDAAAMLRSLLASLDAAREAGRVAGDALRRAEQFIVNGVELGFIRMPDASTPDSAHDTLPAIRAALSLLPKEPPQ
jgi:hypothetical protein